MVWKKRRVDRIIHQRRRITGWSILAFLIALGFSSLLSGIAIRHKLMVERLFMEQLIDEKCDDIIRVLSRLLYKTQALAALVVQSNGSIIDFDRVAMTIVDDPCIQNILVAPDGVISHIYPLRGNEAAIGFDLFGPGDGNEEARIARDTNQLVIGGPFHTVQEADALVGRLPVTIPGPDGHDVFWGLVSVTLKYPDALEDAGLDSLIRQGIVFELWRINPDTGQPQIIAQSPGRYNPDAPHVERAVQLFNAEWRFRMLSVMRWWDFTESWILLAASLSLSVIVGCIVQNNRDLLRVRSALEDMVRTDALTGLLNRVGLFAVLQRCIDNQRPFRLCFMDLNGFKRINDTYGHRAGDLLLIQFCEKITSLLDDDFIFARISGDEFILVRRGEYNESRAIQFWSKLDAEFANPITLSTGESILLSFSRGVAFYPQDGITIDELMSHADTRMYKEKNTRYK